MLDINNLASNIKKYRVRSGLKQFELAEKLYITPQSVSKWEQGLAIPDVHKLCLLADVLGVSVDELLSHNSGKDNLMIAVDGGGTKTEFVLFTENGEIKHRLLLGGCNPNVYGMEKCCEVLKTGIDSLMLSRKNVTGIYCGISGYLSGDNSQRIDAFFKSNYSDVNVVCNGDIFNVMASATKAKRGVVAICGTGFNVCFIEGDKLHRVGGWGYLFDNKGSGFDIGRDAVRAVLAENDGIGPKTILTELIESKLGTKTWDSLHVLYSEDKSFIASFSEDVFKAYKAGDAVAKDIVISNAENCVERINFVADKYDYAGDVILSGGIISGNEDFFEIIQSKLNKKLNMVVPRLPQIYGACVLCCELCDVSSEAFEETFTKDYERVVGRA